MKKILVVQDWFETEENKNGWDSCGWEHEDGSAIPDQAEVVYDDENDIECQSDKYGHPIKGYYLSANA